MMLSRDLLIANRIKLVVCLLWIAEACFCVAQAQDGDFSAGKEKSKLCQGCHGEDGNSIIPLSPSLAGQLPEYLEKQLHDFQSKKRVDSIMTGISLGITSDLDIKDIAAYFSSHKLKAGYKPDRAGKAIFQNGLPDKDMPACASCHGDNGQGKSDENIALPIIGGQTKSYIAKQLRDLRSGVRHNDPDGIMGSVAKKLSDAEIDAVADYASEM